jgi:hypothetical protein
MSEQTVTVTIPAELYDHLKRRAEAGGRALQDEIVETLQASLPEPDVMPAYLTEAITPLSFFSDEQLWQAARSRLPDEDAAEMESLHHKRDREGLNEEQKQRLAGLLKRYERSVLVRAKAAELLHKRGHDVSVLQRAS